MSLGSKIKEFRKSKKLTQKELAEQLDITREALSNYENDKRQPSYNIINKLRLIFNTSADDLIGEYYNSTRLEDARSFFDRYMVVRQSFAREIKNYKECESSNDTEGMIESRKLLERFIVDAEEYRTLCCNHMKMDDLDEYLKD